MAVDNRLRVEPAATVQDRQIERDIRSSMARNMFVDAGKVAILVKNGVVTLKGTVSNYRANRLARDIANYTSGVVRVNNELVVTG
jgi:osmotically-inducible protein OsmY